MRKTISQLGDAKLDKMSALHGAEFDRWCWRRRDDNGLYELVRNTSPNNDINADEYFEITTLTKRECSDRYDAAMWLQTFARRAAMRAALGAL